VRVLLTAILVASCTSEGHVAPQVRIDASTQIAFPRLVGTWSGSVLLPRYGVVTALVTLGPSGAGSYFVTMAGGSQSGSLTILSLEGTRLRARVDGREHSLKVSLQGNTLSTNLPGIGNISATRIGVRQPKHGHANTRSGVGNRFVALVITNAIVCGVFHGNTAKHAGQKDHGRCRGSEERHECMTDEQHPCQEGLCIIGCLRSPWWQHYLPPTPSCLRSMPFRGYERPTRTYS